MERYQVYPNRCGKPREDVEDNHRGALRTGFVEENQEMVKRELAGYYAAVTHEDKGAVRFYVFTSTPADSLFPNIPMWVGPFTGLSEEIVPMDEEQAVIDEIQ